MDFPHASTAFFSALLAGTGGVWLYAQTHREWHFAEFMVAAGVSATFGLGLSGFLCWAVKCNEEEGSGLVIGLCCLGGLAGFNPSLARKMFAACINLIPGLKGILDEPPKQPRDSRLTDPGSDL
jgi:hypothetical protein